MGDSSRAEDPAESWLIGPGAQRELLVVLISPAEVRTDVIRELNGRPGKQTWADPLIDLEENELARATVMEILEDLLAG